jgi:hypothetical protein
VSTWTRTVRADPSAAVLTAGAGIRWTYAPVLLVCVGPGLDTPSARNKAAVRSSASLRSVSSGRRSAAPYPSIMGHVSSACFLVTKEASRSIHSRM